MSSEQPLAKSKITTIKLAQKTKDRIDHVRIYNRESYDEIMQRILEVLNLCKVNPDHARMRLLIMDKERKRNLRNKKEFIDPAHT